jgi:hypothetical protein
MSNFIAGLVFAAAILTPMASIADPLECQDQGIGANCDQTYQSEVNVCTLLPGASSSEIQDCKNAARYKRDECRANGSTCNY